MPGSHQRAREDYILGDPYREAWIRSLRTFVLDGADARFPELGENGYLVVKEPNGSVGAPLLVEAMPESRVILLVRDPRDVVASLLAAQKRGSWGAGEDSLADTDPDEFVRQRARMYDASFGKAWEAYEAHRGHKAVTRYEDLRYDTMGELEKIYSSLGIPIDGGATAKGGREARLGEHPREAERAEQAPPQGQARWVAGRSDARAGEDRGGDHRPHNDRVLPRLGA